jgi:hypothetical protein
MADLAASIVGTLRALGSAGASPEELFSKLGSTEESIDAFYLALRQCVSEELVTVDRTTSGDSVIRFIGTE